jgi:hypothetical protein
MRANKLRELLKSNKPTLSTHIHTTWPSVVESVASPPAAFRVRVRAVMSRGRGPRGGCPPPEGVDVACPLAPMMTLTLSCDHRAVDGARGAQFHSVRCCERGRESARTS